MDPRDIYPTCVLKVNLGCCKACVVRLKKLLSTIDGVYGYDIDSEKGLVTVLGRAHPQLLVEKIRQKKKKAVVVSYEKPTPNAKTKDSNNTKEDKKNGDLDSKPKENKKKHGNGDQKGFNKEDIFGHHESDPHEFEAYVPPKPSALDTCRDPYCKLHHKKPVIIRPSDNMPKVMLQPPLNPPRFLPPPPRFRPPPPGPHYPRSNREEYSEDHRYRLPHVPHVEPIVYDRPLPQYDPWYNQRPQPQHDPWCYQRPAPPLPPHYGHHGAKQAYIGHY
ncbi:heavy metal-associated isoprenylated plant protein 36-like isoform X1 [Rhododendron vialii]|uniref:heavy metal-associated isoprenylated plant protein 36-like isoform X1 n=1 Tax=Rhododendron vialii TaxID=182163 RepID=UPI00265D72E1|nr:heavy metal-associated isoprenylated plant protein 36-like isoform X1 [Rhododendron vialii]